MDDANPMVASTPVENIGIGGKLIVETLANQDHYVGDPTYYRWVPVYTRTASSATEAHNDLLRLMEDAAYCRSIHNRLCEVK